MLCRSHVKDSDWREGFLVLNMVCIYSQLEHKINFTTETTNSDLNSIIELIESDPNKDFCVCVYNE